ncbi:hypothetical protein AXG93_4718s1010 [Marchantia polymorpha subsp. ruderalis]|uniref:Uncharacterized protein n=1 Tax=Marchantia polymorpha subsp. ruderalis TaxID=1480154 RepID=A0A176VRH4_MARPO|nr:hypothetical protein AXG93_4718s1010 [Marchantia polymorpha subsp. ruderalis]
MSEAPTSTTDEDMHEEPNLWAEEERPLVVQNEALDRGRSRTFGGEDGNAEEKECGAEEEKKAEDLRQWIAALKIERMELKERIRAPT